ncbi:MAG: hypothetical protein ACLFMY_07505, partial [Guyparkeria sp.]|uniref:hypothetical protein n=1 Tax=Guyparkeria sp. TaxID=2035736 RepID=UPI003978A0A0
MKKVLLASVMAGLGFGMTGMTTASAADTYEQYQTKIDEREGSGVSGSTILVPQGDGEIEVRVTAENADGLTVGIHTGLCRYANDGEDAPEMLAFDNDPVFELDEIDGDESTTTIEVTVDEMMTEPHSIAIHDGD